MGWLGVGLYLDYIRSVEVIKIQHGLCVDIVTALAAPLVPGLEASSPLEWEDNNMHIKRGGARPATPKSRSKVFKKSCIHIYSEVCTANIKSP